MVQRPKDFLCNSHPSNNQFSSPSGHQSSIHLRHGSRHHHLPTLAKRVISQTPSSTTRDHLQNICQLHIKIIILHETKYNVILMYYPPTPPKPQC